MSNGFGFCEGFSLGGLLAAKPPIDFDYFVKYFKSYTEEQIMQCLYTCVQANAIKEIEYIHKQGVDFNFKINGIDLLLLAVSQPEPVPKLVELLVNYGVDRTAAISEINDRKKRDADPTIRDTIAKVADILRQQHKAHTFIASASAPVHHHSSNNKPTGSS